MTYAPQALYVTESRDYCLGVDLGTTFVAAAICDGARPEMVTLGGRSVVIPSAVYLDDDGSLLCGEAAVHRSVSDPTRAARGFFKRRLGDPTPLRMGGETRSVTELLAALLNEVMSVVTELEGAHPTRVMLTHPANWGPLRRQIFAEVAALAGLGEVPTTTEPEAAAAHYAASRDLPDGRLVAVYDLGGGTFDATVLCARRGGVEIVGVPEGVERLGGIDFDNALFTHLDLLCEGALSSLDANDPRAAVTLARLEQDIVLAKEHLSVDARARVPLFLPERTFDVVVTRTVFEGLIRAHVESTVIALKRTLGSVRVSADELDAILLVGGSSRIPLVAEMLTEALGRPVAVDTHPKYAVALGAARLAAQAPIERVPEMPVMAGRRRAVVLAGAGVAARQTCTRELLSIKTSGPVSLDVFPDADERHLGALDREPGEGAPLLLLAGGAVAAEPGRSGSRGAVRVPAKMVAAAVALLSTGALGYWAHRAGETPIVDAAGPVQSCAGDCVSALGPAPAASPAAADPGCSTSLEGCGAAPHAAASKVTDGSQGVTPARARGMSPVVRPVDPASPPVDPYEDVAAQRPTAGRGGPDAGFTTKPGSEKKASKKGTDKKSTDKKSTGKHKSGSDSSPILDGIV